MENAGLLRMERVGAELDGVLALLLLAKSEFRAQKRQAISQ